MNKKFYARFYFINEESLEIAFDAELNDYEKMKAALTNLLAHAATLDIGDNVIVCKNVLWMRMWQDD